MDTKRKNTIWTSPAGRLTPAVLASLFGVAVTGALAGCDNESDPADEVGDAADEAADAVDDAADDVQDAVEEVTDGG